MDEIKNDKETLEEIQINKIKILDNSRFNTNEDLSELMEDIKHRGLLQAIGVIKVNDDYILRYGERRLNACKKLGWNTIKACVKTEDIDTVQFMADNVAENIHRKDLTPLEFGRVCRRFLDSGMSKKEIAVKLNVTISKVETALTLERHLPREFADKLTYKYQNKSKAGLSASVAERILHVRTSNENISDLLKIAREKELTMHQIDIIGKMLVRGIPLNEALLMLETHEIKTVDIIIDKKKLTNYYMKNGKRTFGSLVRDILKGDLPLDKEMVI